MAVMVPMVVLLLTGVNASVTGHKEPAATALQHRFAVQQSRQPWGDVLRRSPDC